MSQMIQIKYPENSSDSTKLRRPVTNYFNQIRSAKFLEVTFIYFDLHPFMPNSDNYFLQFTNLDLYKGNTCIYF